MANRQGFFDKLLNGPVQTPVVVPATPVQAPVADPVETRAGSVESAGGTSPLPAVMPPARDVVAPLTVTPETAMTIGTVFRCVDIIITSVSQMDLEVFRDDVQIATPSLIKTPDVNEPSSAFVQETVLSLAMYGNAYWRLYGDPVASLEVLDPKSVTVSRDERTGQKVYWVGETRLDATKVRHLKHTRIPGADYGKGPLQFATEEVRQALLVQKFANEWFDTRVVPSGYLSTDQRVSQADRREIGAEFTEYLQHHGGLAVLSQGTKFESPRLRPAEAQMLEVSANANKNIIRMFGIPAMHVTVELGGTSTTYMNLEQTNILFIQNCLTRYMNEIENALTELLPGKQTVRFNETSLLRSDTAAKWNVLKTQVEVGYTDGDELRAAEGKRPLPKKVVEQGDNTDGDS